MTGGDGVVASPPNSRADWRQGYDVGDSAASRLLMHITFGAEGQMRSPGIWQVAKGTLTRVAETHVELERDLEDWITAPKPQA
jgi:hypothetical protein